MADTPIHLLVAGAGFAAGLVFGTTAQRTNFCTMGAISDMVLMGNRNRFRAWILAIAVAMLGSQALYALGVVDLGKSIYLTPNLGWVNMPLRQRLADEIGLTTTLDNDANCAVFGEWWRGAARG